MCAIYNKRTKRRAGGGGDVTIQHPHQRQKFQVNDICCTSLPTKSAVSLLLLLLYAKSRERSCARGSNERRGRNHFYSSILDLNIINIYFICYFSFFRRKKKKMGKVFFLLVWSMSITQNIRKSKNRKQVRRGSALPPNKDTRRGVSTNKKINSWTLSCIRWS